MALKFLNNNKAKNFDENQQIQENQNLQNQNIQQQYNDQEIAQKEALQNLKLQNIQGGQFNEKEEEERKAEQLQSQNQYAQNMKNQYDIQRNYENNSSHCFLNQSDNINSCQQPSLKFLYNNNSNNNSQTLINNNKNQPNLIKNDLNSCNIQQNQNSSNYIEKCYLETPNGEFQKSDDNISEDLNHEEKSQSFLSCCQQNNIQETIQKQVCNPTVNFQKLIENLLKGILAKDEETSQLKDEEKAIYSATIQKLNLGNSGISQNSNKNILNQNNNINYDYDEKTPIGNSFIQKFNQQQFQIEEEELNDYEQNSNMSILDSIYSLKQDLNKQQQQSTNQKLQLIKNFNSNIQTNKPNDDQLDCRNFELVEKCQLKFQIIDQTIQQNNKNNFNYNNLNSNQKITCTPNPIFNFVVNDDKKLHNDILCIKNENRGEKRTEELNKMVFKKCFKVIEKTYITKKYKKQKKRINKQKIDYGSFYQHYWGEVSKKTNINIRSFYHPQKYKTQRKKGYKNIKELKENPSFKSFNQGYIDLILKSPQFFNEAYDYLQNQFEQELIEERTEKVKKFIKKCLEIKKKEEVYFQKLQKQECDTPFLLNTSQQTIKQERNCTYKHFSGLETAKQNTCNNEQGSNMLFQEITIRQQELSQENSQQQHWENQRKDYVFQKIQDYILNNSKCKIPWSDSNLQRVKQHALKYLENYKK